MTLDTSDLQNNAGEILSLANRPFSQLLKSYTKFIRDRKKTTINSNKTFRMYCKAARDVGLSISYFSGVLFNRMWCSNE